MTSEQLVSTKSSKVPEQLQAHSWQPGQSGNPSGRKSKLETLTGVLESLVDRETMARKLIEIATNSDTPALQLEAIKYIYSRIEGTPVQSMRHSTDGSMGAMIFLHPGKQVIDGESKLIE